jgi:hypothetical protein
MKNRAIFLSTLVLIIPSAMAGWILQYDNGTTIRIQDNKVQTLLDQTRTVMDIEDGTITAIDDQSKTYYKGTGEEVAQEINAFFEDLRDKMGVDPRTLPGMDQGTNPTEAPDIQITHTGPGEKIAGYDTEHYSVYINDEKVEELWIAPALRFFTKETADMIRNLSHTVGKAGAPASDYTTSAEYVDMIALQGYPLKVIHFIMGMDQTTQVWSIQEQAIPASEFQIPKGYEKTGYLKVMGMTP